MVTYNLNSSLKNIARRPIKHFSSYSAEVWGATMVVTVTRTCITQQKADPVLKRHTEEFTHDRVSEGTDISRVWNP